MILSIFFSLDYVNDTKSMLDQVPRVLNALIDISISLRRANPVNALIEISEMVYQVCTNELFLV
jgi:hypothetical protein